MKYIAFILLFSSLVSGKQICPAGELPVSVEHGETDCAKLPICVGGFPSGNCPAGSVCGVVKTGVPGCVLTGLTIPPITTLPPNVTTIIPPITTLPPNVTTMAPNTTTTMAPNTTTTMAPNTTTTMAPNTTTTMAPNTTTMAPNTTTMAPLPNATTALPTINFLRF